jgi:hypothetical protein
MTIAPVGALGRAFQYANEYLGGLDHRPVCATASLEQLRARLGIELAQGGVAAEQVIDELIATTEGGHLGSAGRFYAWVIGGSLPSALAADWLTST